MKKVFLLIVLASFVFSGCEEVIKVEVEKGETMLVVDAFLNDNGATQKIRLTTTAEYFSNAPTPAALGASVTLTDLNAAATFTFTGDGLGNYVYVPQAGDTLARVGHVYQLSISYNGGSYAALSTLNRTTTIDTILFKRQKTGIEDTTAEPKKYFPYLVARDAPGAMDFYWIKTYRNGVFYNGPGQLNVVQDAGGTGTDGIYIIPPNAFFILTPDNDPIRQLDACTIEMYSINKDTYDFLLQMQIQMNNAQSGLFATAPENVRTNIKRVSSGGLRAIGWFNMGATTSKTVIAS
jgi:hypothetical protein